MNDAPILPPSRPFLRDVHHGEIQHFQQAVIRRENRLGFGDLAKLAIETLNGIGRIDQPTNLLRELEIRAQIRPVFPPGSGDPGILLSPGFFKGIQGALGRRFIYCGINSFEIGHERFQILVGHIFARIAQLVDNAVLDVCLWKHCIDGVRKPSQVVCARDENVVDPSIFEAAEHHRPVLGALVFPDPHAQNVLAVFQINSNGDIHGLFYDLPFAADMVVDGVHENDGMTDPKRMPLVVGIMRLKSSGAAASSWNLILAGTAISMIPMMIIYLIFNRYCVAGMTSGAVKG